MLVLKLKSCRKLCLIKILILFGAQTVPYACTSTVRSVSHYSELRASKMLKMHQFLLKKCFWNLNLACFPRYLSSYDQNYFVFKSLENILLWAYEQGMISLHIMQYSILVSRPKLYAMVSLLALVLQPRAFHVSVRLYIAFVIRPVPVSLLHVFSCCLAW